MKQQNASHLRKENNYCLQIPIIIKKYVAITCHFWSSLAFVQSMFRYL